jgi:hypothetical protein
MFSSLSEASLRSRFFVEMAAEKASGLPAAFLFGVSIIVLQTRAQFPVLLPFFFPDQKIHLNNENKYDTINFRTFME